MKIALLGNSQFAVSTAWGLCQSETETSEIVFVSDGTSRKNRLVTSKEGTPESLRDLVASNALSASDTTISFSDSLENLSGADVILLLPSTGQSGFRSPQASKTTGLAIVKRFVPAISSTHPMLQFGGNITRKLHLCMDASGTRGQKNYRSRKRTRNSTLNC